MKLTAADFVGSWQIERQMTDLRIRESGTLTGDAVFANIDGVLHYSERGTLRFAGGAPMLAERRYRWIFDKDDVRVTYDDDTPFHSFGRVGAPAATPHLCGDDLYNGTYSFLRFPDWQVTWTVQGPRKDYRSVTQYTRA